MAVHHDEERARVGAASAKMISAAHDSCADTARHVKSSREALARSFETLARPFTKPEG